MTSDLSNLISRIAARDRSSLRALYTATAPRLMGLCMHILDDREQAESALKNAYIAVWQRAGAYSTASGEALDWLAAIARREALHLRHKVGREQAPRKIDVQLAAQTRSSLPATSKLKGRIEKIPADGAQALIMAYVYGLTYSELADVLKVKPAAASMLVTTALTALRD